MELDPAISPEMEVSSTVVSGNSNNSSDTDQSNGTTAIATVDLNAENQFKVSGYKYAH